MQYWFNLQGLELQGETIVSQYFPVYRAGHEQLIAFLSSKNRHVPLFLQGCRLHRVSLMKNRLS